MLIINITIHSLSFLSYLFIIFDDDECWLILVDIFFFLYLYRWKNWSKWSWRIEVNDQIKTQIKYKHILRNIVDGKTGEPQENGQDLANDNTTNEQQQHITDYNDYINDDVEAIIC